MRAVAQSLKVMAMRAPESQIAEVSLQQIEPLPVRVTLPVMFWADGRHHVTVQVLGFAAVHATPAEHQLDMFPRCAGL
jgi:hypothetical protein